MYTLTIVSSFEYKKMGKAMKAYGFVFARGGSKGVPHKNTRLLCGKPLIAYAITAGLASGCIDKMIVSTDSKEIAEVAQKYGAEVPFLRPAELATDSSPEWLSWQHAVRFLQNRGDVFDMFISLPSTVPLRKVEDIQRCISVFKEGECDIVISCTEAGHSPYFNMIKMDDNGYASIVNTNNGKTFFRRQDAPSVYDMTATAYVTTPSFILNNTKIWDGRVKAVMVDRISGIDIDEPIDFELAEYFMNKRKE